MHNQKCSTESVPVRKPKNLPPSIRMSSLGHFGLAHFEIIPEEERPHIL